MMMYDLYAVHGGFMKKFSASIFLLIFGISFLFAQTNNSQNLLERMDEAVKELAQKIHQNLLAENAQKAAVGQFLYRESATPLGSYWLNQLTEELTNITGRPYQLISGIQGANQVISGEIVEVAGTIRIYARLVRSGDRVIIAAYHSDFERSAALNAMLAIRSAATEETGGGGSSTANYPDEFEPDSFDNPVLYEIAESEDFAELINRSIYPGGDEDFFLLVPEISGRLLMETTRSTDTYMEFYDAETRDRLAYDDDGGQGTNARIRINVEAGRSYILKIRGYSTSTTGNYVFKAFMIPAREGATSWDNPHVYEIGEDESVAVVNGTLEEGSEDFYLLIPEYDGRLVMETTGRTDTYMEFYDAETKEMLADDDDSGQSYNARIRYMVQAGKRYIALVKGYNDSETGDYAFRAYLLSQNRMQPDEYEPDDEPSQASIIEIGEVQQHTFHNADDVDWVKFQITQPGRYTIKVRGVNSNRLDTYIELFDANLISIAEDDDGGEYRDSMLSLNLPTGWYYLKVWCLDDEPNQPYTIRIETE